MLRKWFFVAVLMSIGLYAQSNQWNASALRPGDVLAISVFRMAEFDTTARIEEDGSFRFPLCGEIRAAGLNTKDVANVIAEKLSQQITTPHVDVFVETWGPRTVYILGEVKNSGMSLELPTNGNMTALQAISAAGGFTESADPLKVAVLRRDSGKQQLTRMPIDVSALISKDSGGDEFILFPEDTIIVPKAPPVYVSGLVEKPGLFYINTQRPPLCSEMITRAGGLSEGANAENVQIVRTLADGSRRMFGIPLREIQDGAYEKDVVVEPGDDVVVTNAAQIYVLGEVKSPGPLVLNPGVVVTASRAIALCGGFTQIAKQNDVLLIRENKISILNMKKLYTDEENLRHDVVLQYGDILYVKESMW